MKLKYSKKIIKNQIRIILFHLIIGIILIGVDYFFKLNTNNVGFAFLITALFYLFDYIYKSKTNYISIKNKILTIHNLIPKKINLSEVINIKLFAGDFIIKIDKKDFFINTEKLDNISIEKLNLTFKSLNLINTKI